MIDDPQLSVQEATARYCVDNRLPKDGGLSARNWVLVTVGGIQLRLKNFQWRQRAIPYHDLHHVLTGYACSVKGEFEMAAWEFAAGRFRLTTAIPRALIETFTTASVIGAPVQKFFMSSTRDRACALIRLSQATRHDRSARDQSSRPRLPADRAT